MLTLRFSYIVILYTKNLYLVFSNHAVKSVRTSGKWSSAIVVYLLQIAVRSIHSQSFLQINVRNSGSGSGENVL